MQSTEQKRDKTLMWVFIICFLISLTQNIFISRGISGSIIGESIGNFLGMVAIVGIIGLIANLILKSKKGYWIGLIFAVAFDIWVLYSMK